MRNHLVTKENFNGKLAFSPGNVCHGVDGVDRILIMRKTPIQLAIGYVIPDYAERIVEFLNSKEIEITEATNPYLGTFD